MSEQSLHTVQLHACVDRMRAGDRAAANELLVIAAARLEKLARRMLGGYPAVRSQFETGDVLQGALLRLMRSLQAVRPESTRSFFNLAAVQMRRELLDLARAAARRLRLNDPVGEASGPGAQDVAAPSDPDLDRWARLHEAVEELPVDEREVIGLTFYHGWAQAEIAELLQVSDRQVRRLWKDAVKRLNVALGGDLPEL